MSKTDLRLGNYQVKTPSLTQLASQDINPFGQSVLALSNAAGGRTLFGLGTAATANTGAFATANQGAKADSALQPAAIGSTVQGYDADLDAIAALTTTSFGRSFLTQANTAASRLLVWGLDIQIGGLKPTTRSNGSALVSGDRWLDTADRLWWQWNGTYWLSQNLYFATASFNLIATTQGLGVMPYPAKDYDVFLEDFTFSFVLNNPQNATDFWRVQLERQNTAGNQTMIATTDVSDLSHTTGLIGIRRTVAVNLHQDVSALPSIGWRIAAYRQGASGGINQPSFSVSYRLAKP